MLESEPALFNSATGAHEVLTFALKFGMTALVTFLLTMWLRFWADRESEVLQFGYLVLFVGAGVYVVADCFSSMLLMVLSAVTYLCVDDKLRHVKEPRARYIYMPDELCHFLMNGEPVPARRSRTALFSSIDLVPLQPNPTLTEPVVSPAVVPSAPLVPDMVFEAAGGSQPSAPPPPMPAPAPSAPPPAPASSSPLQRQSGVRRASNQPLSSAQLTVLETDLDLMMQQPQPQPNAEAEAERAAIEAATRAVEARERTQRAAIIRDFYQTAPALEPPVAHTVSIDLSGADAAVADFEHDPSNPFSAFAAADADADADDPPVARPVGDADRRLICDADFDMAPLISRSNRDPSLRAMRPASLQTEEASRMLTLDETAAGETSTDDTALLADAGGDAASGPHSDEYMIVDDVDASAAADNADDESVSIPATGTSLYPTLEEFTATESIPANPGQDLAAEDAESSAPSILQMLD